MTHQLAEDIFVGWLEVGSLWELAWAGRSWRGQGLAGPMVQHRTQAFLASIPWLTRHRASGCCPLPAAGSGVQPGTAAGTTRSGALQLARLLWWVLAGTLELSNHL